MSTIYVSVVAFALIVAFALALSISLAAFVVNYGGPEGFWSLRVMALGVGSGAAAAAVLAVLIALTVTSGADPLAVGPGKVLTVPLLALLGAIAIWWGAKVSDDFARSVGV